MLLRKFIYFLICTLVTIGCTEVFLPESNPQIVVEGWIEDNSYPIVILTTSIPINKQIKNIESLNEYLIRWGKVTIYDGEKEVVLIGRKDTDYFPPYVYTTSEIKGDAGKSYSIKVEYSGRTLTATTTIPEPAALEYIKVKKSSEEGSYYLTGGLIDNPSTKDYYKVFVKRAHKDSTYKPSFMGLTNDDILSETIEEIPINCGIPFITDEDKGNFFSHDDIVFIRFCSIDEQSFNYWSDFESIYSLSKNPFFPSNSRIRSNINGGLGYWSGYGSSYYIVSIADSLKLGRIY